MNSNLVEPPHFGPMTVIPDTEIALLQDEENAGLMRDTLDGLESLFDLPQLRVPTGGSPAWTYEERGKTVVKPELLGVIIAVRKGMRKFYATKMGDGDSGPPTCESRNGVDAVGINDRAIFAAFKEAEAKDPDTVPPVGRHDCAPCPHSKRGGDCDTYSLVYFLPLDSIIPLVLSVPPTSGKGLNSYIIDLIGAKQRIHQVVTKLTLTVVDKKVKHSRIAFEEERELADDEKAPINLVAEWAKWNLESKLPEEAEVMIEADYTDSSADNADASETGEQMNEA